jgi:subtilisin-like proprotein convertase family protein
MNQKQLRLTRTAIVAMAFLVAGSGRAGAEVNRTPIAVPLIGTSQVASPYPSTINVVARGGPAQTGAVSLVLHNVTHPCPKDLSVLLVHGEDKYLIMNNVGGCRPMQGTTIEFVSDPIIPLIPTSPPLDSPPFPDFMRVGASFEGPQPAPPPPFPSGGFIISGFPPPTVTIDGRWDLYVIDKEGGNRGVIAGGWSLNYDTALRSSFRQVTLVPRGGFTSGPAQVYPITFDMSQARDDLRVTKVTVRVDFSHEKPDDLVIVLKSPNNTAVALMANAGGAVNVPGVTIDFDDAAVDRPPNDGPIPSGRMLRYLPTVWPEAVPAAVPPPGPQPPYRPPLAAFNGEPVRGQWTLWVYDDSTNGTGLLAEASIVISTVALADVSITSPTATSTSTQPFVRVEGLLPGGGGTDGIVTWRVTNQGTYYDAGQFTLDAQTGRFTGEVPVKRGANAIQLRAWNTGLMLVPNALQVAVNEFTYSLAEGATGSFFDLDVTLGNPGTANAPVRVDLLPEGGTPVTHPNVVTAGTPLRLPADTLLPDAAVSTVVHSTDAVPLAVERTMSWDARGYGGHGGGAASPATRWLFAEGSQGFFNTFVLLANDNATAADVTVRFLLEGGGVVSHPVTVPPRARRTIFAGNLPQVVNRSFGLDITANVPIIAERAMYFSMGTNRVFDGGHESAGVNQTATKWFLAEGATGPFFDCFLLLSNPNTTAANVTLTYLLSDGRTIPQTVQLPANSRHTINVETVDTRLANAAVSTIVSSDAGIVVERAMYWPNAAEGWREAHNSFGVTETGLRWAVADARVGGQRGYDTYILLANPNPVPAEVQVRFLKPGVAATRTYTLAPTSRLNVHAATDVPELGEGAFSADIQVLNFQPIAVEKAMYWNADGVVWAAGTNVTATRMPPQ